MHFVNNVRDAASAALTLCRSPSGEERTTISWHCDEEVLRLDRTHSSLDPDVGRGVHDAPLSLVPREPLTLTVFADRSVVEVFANRRAALTARIYPTDRTEPASGCSPPAAAPTSAAAAYGAAHRSGDD